MARKSAASEVMIRDRALEPLRRVLETWIEINVKLRRQWAPVGDCPWWYNERASLSLLAGAAWRLGGYAFEEFADRKVMQGRRAPGRIDIEFRVGRSSFKAEAKHRWLSMGDGCSFDSVVEAIEAARGDVKKVKPWKARRLAIVFAAPSFPRSRADEARKRIDSFVRGAKGIKAGAVAWVFPDLPGPLAKRSHYPGTAVWIREVKR